MRPHLLAFASLLALSAGVGFAPAGEQRQPNVVLILSDDQGYGDLRMHGNDKIDTPVLDAFARQGAQFDRFFVSPVCAPTRASLMTGRYFPRTGVVGVVPDYKATMRSEEVTLGEVFKRAGYATGLFGKWHLGKWHPYLPNPQGFDEYVGFRSGATGDYFDALLDHNNGKIQTRGYITDALTDHAIAFIEKHREAPFFCYLPYNVPHKPHQVPKGLLRKYQARGLSDDVAAVYGMLDNMDENIGRLLARLDELGLADNTIVWFLSDNGPDGPRRFNAGMRGGKGGCEEGGVRVPSFVRWPGHITKESRVAPLAADIDVLPTLVELCGIAKPDTLPLDGRSLAPLLLGRDTAWPERSIYNVRMNGDHGKPPRFVSGAVRTDRWRLVTSGGAARLSDMLADPEQTQDVAAQHPKVVAALRADFERWFAEVYAHGYEQVPVPVGYDAEPVVVLESPDSHLEGTVSVKGKVNWDIYWIHSWRDTNDHAWWNLDVVDEARYRVSVVYRQSPNAAPVDVSLVSGGKRLDVTLPGTTGGKAAEPRQHTFHAGEFELPAGRCQLDFRLRGKVDPSFALNSIRLEKLPKH